jgi:hypothetical protein
MKTPRIEDFHPDAAEKQKLASPLDGMPAIVKPQIVPSSPASKPARTVGLGNRVPSPTAPIGQQTKIEKPEKYTTHLEPSLVKKLKVFAVERELKDYEVVRHALLSYLEKHK